MARVNRPTRPEVRVWPAIRAARSARKTDTPIDIPWSEFPTVVRQIGSQPAARQRAGSGGKAPRVRHSGRWLKGLGDDFAPERAKPQPSVRIVATLKKVSDGVELKGTMWRPVAASLITLPDTVLPVLQLNSIPTLDFAMVLDLMTTPVVKLNSIPVELLNILLDVTLAPSASACWISIPTPEFVTVLPETITGEKQDIPSKVAAVTMLPVTLPRVPWALFIFMLALQSHLENPLCDCRRSSLRQLSVCRTESMAVLFRQTKAPKFQWITIAILA